jgi:serine O-acetyltransferase
VIGEDLLRTYRLIPGSRLRKIVGCYRTPGVHAVVTLRFGQWLLHQGLSTRVLLTPLYLIQYHRMKAKWGIDIPRQATVGSGFYIGHFGGITVSPLATIGENVNISQQVTIGVSGKGEARGCPVIGDSVYLAPGAKVFGKIRVGNNVRIGANAVVYKDVPDDAIVVLDPGFKVIPIPGEGNPGEAAGTKQGAPGRPGEGT